MRNKFINSLMKLPPITSENMRCMKGYVINLKYKHPEAIKFLEEKYPNVKSTIEKIYLYINNLQEPPVCKTCGKPVKFNSFLKGYHKYCCLQCANDNPEMKNKKLQSSLDKYGGHPLATSTQRSIAELRASQGGELDHMKLREAIKNYTITRREYSIRYHFPKLYLYLSDNYSKARSFQEKLYLYVNELQEPKKCIYCNTKSARFISYDEGYADYCSRVCASKGSRKKAMQTNIERYGTPYPQRLEEIKERIRKNNLEKYGVEYAIQLKEIQDKIKFTNLERYGVENPFASKEIQEKIKRTNLEKYGHEYATQSREIQEKSKRTNLEKLGVEYPTQSKEVQEKIKQTYKEHYNVEWITQAEEFKEKSKRTNLEKLGVEYPTQSPKVQEKIRRIFLEKYGYEHATQSPEVQEKTRQTNLKNLGVEYPMQSPEIFNKSLQTIKEKYSVDNVSKNPEIQKRKEETCMKNHGVPYGTALTKNYYIGLPNQVEQKILYYLDELGIVYEYGVWNLITNENNHAMQLDIYIKDLNIAIEINGVYFHSIQNPSVERNQHIYKHIKCHEVGIELIYLWEDWINKNFDIVKNFLKAKLDNSDISIYKNLLFPDLGENEWPLDLGYLKNYEMDLNNIKEHMCMHGGFKCFDSGIVQI